MEDPIQVPAITCSQCGGELHPDEGQTFLTCPYCGATVYLDKSRVVFHWYLAPTLDENRARENLARWMAGNETVKDLDKKSQVAGQSFQYFPMWVFKRRVDGREQIDLQPAAATSITELRRLPLTAGDLRKYEPSLAGQSQEPSVPLQAALEWERSTAGAGVEILESALVHVPLYTFKYLYKNQPYTAIVEAASGKTLANIFPAKSEAPYQIAGIITAAVFLCLATIPIIANATSSDGGAGTGLLICAGVGIVAAPLLFALAAWIAAKV